MHAIDMLIDLQNEKTSEVNMLFLHLLNFHEFNMSGGVTFVSQQHKLAKQKLKSFRSRL